jgi:hypothetical protein
MLSIILYTLLPNSLHSSPICGAVQSQKNLDSRLELRTTLHIALLHCKNKVHSRSTYILRAFVRKYTQYILNCFLTKFGQGISIHKGLSSIDEEMSDDVDKNNNKGLNNR